ncbi:hypothetical protein llap_22577 [Limosa lapponica baueri]|uniref:Cadherin domain-containing protein n=1 Tax=Limosa lapponica baueri TaxID=1758121 RepID=A0A2I0T000_LIMLA|nr:hypothetical protein llap_22577 [Limosa lapponica baueri]
MQTAVNEVPSPLMPKIASIVGGLWVTFSLTSGNIGRAFEIRTTNNTYGEVFIARPLDRELLDHYTLRIQASDGGVPPRRKEHTLRVNILDVNDNPPIIDSPFGYNVSVSEVSSPAPLFPSSQGEV